MFGSKDGRAVAWLLAKTRTGYQQHFAVLNRRLAYIIYRYFDVGRIAPVVDEGEGVWGLNANHRGCRAAIGLARHKFSFDALVSQEFDNEIGDQVVPNRCQHGCSKPKTLCADDYVGRAAADVGGEAFDFGETYADLICIQVKTGAPHRDKIIHTLIFAVHTSP